MATPTGQPEHTAPGRVPYCTRTSELEDEPLKLCECVADVGERIGIGAAEKLLEGGIFGRARPARHSVVQLPLLCLALAHHERTTDEWVGARLAALE